MIVDIFVSQWLSHFVPYVRKEQVPYVRKEQSGLNTLACKDGS